MGMVSRQTLLLFLKGMAMGVADSVPGVSGGTIAFIANVYDELLASIRAINPSTLRLLFTQGPRAAFFAINGPFLLALGMGIVGALLLSANLVLWLLEYRYTYLMCFFSGLILASLWYVSGQVTRWDASKVALLLAGMAFSVGIALLPRLPGSDSLLFYFISGAIAICAMILPGISGAFILLLLGAYEPVMTALTSLDWPVVLVFVAGCGTGLLSFSRLLYWLLLQHRARTLAGLLGFLAGSLYTLWPWRHEVVDANGRAEFVNGLPAMVDAYTGDPVSAGLAAGFLFTGCALVLGLEQVGRKSGVKSGSSAC
jgi:putative membrane protein